MKFFEELKRRNVIKATIAYVVVAWILLQVATMVLPIVGAPEWVLKTLSFFLAICLPIWIIFSWVYEVTPEGLKKTAKISKEQSITTATNKRLNIIILITLIIAIAVAFINKPNSKASNVIVDNQLETDDSIAVLYFDDFSEGNDTEWFCDGVIEDIYLHLSKIKGLRVIARTSVLQYKDSVKTIPEIAKELGVSYVVEGSVRRQENNILITVNLINATNEHVWSDKYNEKLEDVFKIQNDVSKKIVQQLKIVISPKEEKALGNIPTDNIEAYQLFLKARTILASWQNKEDLERSIELFEQAITLDPNYADAYAEIADCYLSMSYWGHMNDDDAKKKIIDFTNKALQINPNTSRVYSILGNMYIRDSKWEDARENLEKAIAINPNDASAYVNFALYFSLKPEFDAKNSLLYTNKAVQLEPSSYKVNKIVLLIYNDKIKEAEELINEIKNEKVGDFDFGLETYLSGLLNSYKNKDWTESIHVLKKALEKEPNNPDIHGMLAHGYFGILRDYPNMLKHAHRAYELDTLTEGNSDQYLFALILNKKFTRANELLNNSIFMQKFSDDTKNSYLSKYHYYQGNYKKGLVYIKKLKNEDFDAEAEFYAKLGDSIKTYDLLNNHIQLSISKALVFAVLKEKDSMYHYLNKENHPAPMYALNGYDAFDPYRNEPRYKAFLKKNYLPVTNKLD